MAIRVVQGLIDTGRNPARPDVARTNPVQPQAATNQQIQQQAVQAQKAAVSAIPNALKQVDAALLTVRARGTQEQQKLETPEEAKRVADSVADRVREGEDELSEAHSNLSSSSARPHFQG